MKHILLAGDWKDCLEFIHLLYSSGYLVTLLPDKPDISIAADLVIARKPDAALMGRLSKSSTAWLAWCPPDPEELMARAYQSGATAAFLERTPAEVVLQIIQRTLESLAPKNEKQAVNVAQRRYQRGDLILLEPEAVLDIQKGIIAQTMVHLDGSEVLLGLCGPNQLMVPHPADTCYIQLVAHTDAMVTIKSWSLAARDADFSDRLRFRLQQMEAWAAMQARPHLEQRVLGILSLLAEQFGVSTPQGQMIDVRITHVQLASAVGATRTTITRTLGELRRQGALSLIQTTDGERICLLHGERVSHGMGSSH